MRANLKSLYYSFPVQLFLLKIRSHHMLLLCWILLFLIVTGNFGAVLGIPSLFLDPEYLGSVGFLSYLIIGICVAWFSMSFQITCYILETHYFAFLGTISRPFTKYTLNNAFIPMVFLFTYFICILNFQFINYAGFSWLLVFQSAGLLVGFALMTTLFLTYFSFTNKDVFQLIASNVEKRLKRVPLTRGNILNRYKTEIKSEIHVDNYITLGLKVHKVVEKPTFFKKEAILQVFGQNHLNSVIIELVVFVILLVLGIFRDNPYFQIPAAASAILLLTVFLMMVGAFSYWFGKWAFTLVILAFFGLNYLVKNDIITSDYEAYGLNYSTEKAEYSTSKIAALSSPEQVANDKEETIKVLEKWKAAVSDSSSGKPKFFVVCASGGGQRAALWTLVTLQQLDSATDNNFFSHLRLISGASGGLIGASYYRELMLRQLNQEDIRAGDPAHLKSIAKDNLNPIIYSLLVNDLFIRYQHFDYGGMSYIKDRGYAFEQQLLENTDFVLEKRIRDYRAPELSAQIPMLLVAPTIMNDGRKLYISPLNISYMNSIDYGNRLSDFKFKGVEFRTFFAKQGADNLRFLSALRMSATFPYIAPNVTLPSEPDMLIMDAGISDNFGISDATRFVYVFRDWIKENTSGVVFVAIRDSEKKIKVSEDLSPSLVQKITNPITSFYSSWDRMQDIRNDNQMEYLKAILDGKFELVEFEYLPIDGQRASLNWRLTNREKKDIIESAKSIKTQKNLKRVQELLR